MGRERIEHGPDRDWVLLDWATRRCRCPNHGLLPDEQQHEPGPAICGCTFVAGPGGLLRAVRQSRERTITRRAATTP